MPNFIHSVVTYKVLLRSANKGKGMGEVYVTPQGQKCITKFWLESVDKEDHLEDLRVDGKIQFIFGKKMIGGRRWNKLAKHKEKRRAFVKMAINIWVTRNVGSFWTLWGIVSL